MTNEEPLNKLKAFLAELPDGPLEERLQELLVELLANSWRFFEGGGGESMEGCKLLPDKHGRRVETPAWTAPFLTFRIERHGRLELGSTRADVDNWRVNVELCTAKIVGTSRRQKRPLSPRYKPIEDVKRIVEFLSSDRSSSEVPKGLRLLNADVVKVAASEIIPSGYDETNRYRRKRFVDLLVESMDGSGWHLSGSKRDRHLKFEKIARSTITGSDVGS